MWVVGAGPWVIKHSLFFVKPYTPTSLEFLVYCLTFPATNCSEVTSHPFWHYGWGVAVNGTSFCLNHWILSAIENGLANFHRLLALTDNPVIVTASKRVLW